MSPASLRRSRTRGSRAAVVGELPAPEPAARRRSRAAPHKQRWAAPGRSFDPETARARGRDRLFVLLALAQGLLVSRMPSVAVIGLGLWWNSNTISHNFIHRPFFRRRWANGVFSLYLSGLLGIPQSVWRARHLAHHAGRPWRLKCTPLLPAEIAVVLATWTAIAWSWPTFWWTVYAPGYVLGLSLCAVHGHYEHRGGTTSHYGRLYNWLFFNDGYHVEHHASPGRHWSRLPERAAREGRRSRWPAVLRWLELFSLDSLERAVLGWRRIEEFLVRRHERAIARLLAGAGRIERVAIVGGGLFPRSVLAVRRVLPDARLAVIDASQENLNIARRYVADPVEWIHAWYDRRRHRGFDLVVIPLAFVGDRQAIYRDPPAAAVLVHDWIWRRRGRGTVVSFLLLKRLNLVRP